MAGIRQKNAWTLFLLTLSGIVLGGFVGSLTENIAALRWMNYGQTFGLTTPVVLDLGILILTFGLTLRITIASMIGVLFAIFIYRMM